MPLSDVELRVLGSLLEKERTTPESYPLSSQALLSACNQRTNRDPVTDYHLQDVLSAVDRLRDRALAETVQGVGDRVPKHRQRASAALDLDRPQVAVLAVLLLRGPQTPGELRTRTERYVDFHDLAGVENALRSLANRSVALVENVGRGPGQSQDRWVHTLGTDEQKMAPRARPARDSGNGERAPITGTASESGEPPARTQSGTATVTAAPVASESVTTVADLVRRIEALEKRVSALETRNSDA